MLDPAVERMVADAGGVAALSTREAYAVEHYGVLIQRMREAHALSGQMVACLEACDLSTFGTLCAVYTRTNHSAGEALICFDAVRSSEGSA